MYDLLNISVALCTFNGARFLSGQLASLAEQTLLPTELVVCDDASDDGTWHLLEAFRHRAPFPVRLHRNANRLGIGQNFEQAIRHCFGDVIALCDQDDVWLPDKLMLYSQRFMDGADAVCCDARITNAMLVPLGYTLWDRVTFTGSQRRMAGEGRMLEVLLKHYVVAGATLAFRTELRNCLLPIPPHWLYDAWLAAVLATNGSQCIVDECLQLYRQHENNAIGGQHRSIVSQLQSTLTTSRAEYLSLEISRWEQFKERLISNEISSYTLRQVEEKLRHLQRRARFPSNRLLRTPHVLSEIFCGGYSKYSRNWGSIALDNFMK
jgi:glycosyltransferase involved in cell wall biosynthesis